MRLASVWLAIATGAPAIAGTSDVPEQEVRAQIVCDGAFALEGAVAVLGWRESGAAPANESSVTLDAGGRGRWSVPAGAGWRFQLRPQGFQRTTWAPGTEIPGDAQTYVLEADGVPKDLGTIRVDCAPAVRLVIDVEPAADLRLARIEGRWRESDEAPWQPLRGLSLVAAKDFLLVHRLPEGEGTIEFTIKHPHLLDEPFAVATLRGKRYRGGLHQAVAEARGLGGAIRYSGAKRLKLVPRPEGAIPSATRAPSEESGFALNPSAGLPAPPVDRTPRIVDVDPDWRAAVSVAPGVYDVHACGEPDPECERVEKLWSGIRILPGSTIELR